MRVNFWKARWWAPLGVAIIGAVNLIQISQANAAPPATMSLSQHQWVAVRDLILNDSTDFGGVSVNASTGTAGIYRVSSRAAEPATQATIANVQRIAAIDDGLPKRWNVSIVDVAHSLSELNSTKAQITTMQPWAQDSQPYLAVWYVDAAANAVHVGVTQITPTLVENAKAFGGKVTLAVENRPSPTTRSADSPPWWGGDVISGCTSGFSVTQRSNGHQGVLTAGHCFSNGAAVYNGGRFMGYVTWRVYGGGSYDAEFIDTAASSGGSGAVVYTGGLNDWATAQVTSFLNALPGDQVCTDGSVNFQNCNANVVESNLCVQYVDGQTVCGLDGAQSTNGSWIVQKGDSGGPVYWYSNPGAGYITAVGTISGESGTGQGSTTVYFTDFSTDLNNNFRMACVFGCS